MTIPSVDLSAKPEVTGFFDDQSSTISYVVRDPTGAACAVIDPVMEFDQAAARLTFDGADRIIAFIRERGLTLEWIIETHVHADHLSGAPYIQEKLGGRIGIGEHVQTVQDMFGRIFNEGTEFQRDGSQFDKLFVDGDTYRIGTLPCFALHTPGHTPACMVHVVGDSVFTGDTLFMPDGGSARADFPGGDAGQLYDSIQRVLSLPDEMRLFICHDYGPGGRAIAWLTTIGEQKAANVHVGGDRTREEFVRFRTERDAQLALPTLILPSLQVNIRAGEVPKDGAGNMMLKTPVNKL
ncbi:MAG: MBL fold metallo-hydrolase [Pseudomonadota bacterium]